MSFQQMINYGDRAFLWTMALIVPYVSAYIVNHIKNKTVSLIMSRAWGEIQSAVLEVRQVYVDAIKTASEDGKLTSEEKAEAKNQAIAKAKSNIGIAGIKRLAAILGVEDATNWIANKIESAVSINKKTSIPLDR